MCTAAEFNRVAGSNYSYCVAVLLTEQCHCTELLSLLDRHFLHSYGDSCEDRSVYDLLNVSYLLLSHSGEVVEVETASLFVYELTSLMNVVAENCTERVLEKMC